MVKNAGPEYRFDLVVFNNRLRVNFDYFQKKTDPLLVYTGVPFVYGGTSVPANVGGQVTKGYTVVLNYALLKRTPALAGKCDFTASDFGIPECQCLFIPVQ